jgi:carbamoyltransferase
MYILGLSFNFHDAAACLVCDGEVLAAAEEERFTRLKHDRRFPVHAVEFCLSEAGIRASDLDGVVFYEKPVRKAERSLRIAKNHLDHSSKLLRGQLSQHLSEDLRLETLIREKIGYQGPVYYSEHHLSHAASAYYLSPFEDAAVLTIDGVGEWATTAQFAARGTELRPLREIHYPHSLGLFYSALTSYLGFQVNEDEYKVMGLAPYGVPRYRRELEQIIRLLPDGSFVLAPEHFCFSYSTERMHTPALEDLLGPARLRTDAIEERHKDIAASF